jgi:hypothetical protein
LEVSWNGGTPKWKILWKWMTWGVPPFYFL